MQLSRSIGVTGVARDAGELIADIVSRLPALPPVIRYYDEFDDTTRSIAAPTEAKVFELWIYGRLHRLDFDRYPGAYGMLVKHLFLFLLGRGLHVVSAFKAAGGAMHFSASEVEKLIDAGPHKIGHEWTVMRARHLPQDGYRFGKTLLRLLRVHRLCGWSTTYEEFIRSSLPGPVMDSHAGVRSGDVFLSVDEEAMIVRHLDETVSALTLPMNAHPEHEDLCDAGMLLCAYQFAMRPIQIAMLTMRNVRIWVDVPDEPPTVHLTFHMAKQKSDTKRKPLTRRVKREWAPILVALNAQRRAAGLTGAGRFFAVESNYEAGSRIAALVRKLIDSEDLGTATDLRHTAAQRLVDAGASHEELAEFLGHSHIQTGLVYYETSATHAERVNRALGASDIYRRVAKIAHDRFISPEELTLLKGEQQIAGVPHGIPIAGIGGCTSGQPACPYNPVTSCYGCRKFMPLHDKAMHESVLASMREVVAFFEQSSRGDTRSPTYLQLQRTIAEIQTVIGELEGDD
ncbi:site-specific integrase [Paraburkholderia megapolitana]|uniref:Phage integrase family protein n=1 Tax=Paraburkholderia megapolitana TaxID=420953 RepID=A0A1I3WFM4_9BURK|nr:tyrosine-type recombinase/integrase [Paraburkholderia megapolitana]QDQ82213.1 tyrosine-type recombinase/integrase [Paraburkholderia megapolitana]QDQ84037.1 tyrosine-type recombinase/integrase [Paraburkholderia megapolitana]SFK06358.1 Phage integrase family protein [Paraburkholderia megapolitana]